MSLLPFSRYRFFNDPFFYYDLDLFDPWYDWDLFPSFSSFSSRYRRFKQRERISQTTTTTVNKARSYEQLPPPPPPPFQVQLDINGFNPDKIQKRIEGRTLVVEGRQEDRREERSCTTRQMRETFQIPENLDPNSLTSYVTSNNKLVVEVPYKSSQSERQLQYTNDNNNNNNNRSLTSYDQNRKSSFNNLTNYDDSSLQPRIVTKGNNQKQLEVVVDVKGYRPEQVQVSVRNNELIVQGEREQNDNNRSEKSTFYKSATLPRGVQVDQLQSHLNDNGELRIEAPVF